MPFDKDKFDRNYNRVAEALLIGGVKGLEVFSPPPIDDFDPSVRVSVRCWYRGKYHGSELRFRRGRPLEELEVELLRGLTWDLLTSEKSASKQIYRAAWLVRKWGDHPLWKLELKEWWLGMKMRFSR